LRTVVEVPVEEVRELESCSGCFSLDVFLEVHKDNSGVETFTACDCSGAGSRSYSIRAVIPVMGVHSDYSECSFECNPSAELAADAHDVLLCSLERRCKAKCECPSRC